MVDAFYGTASDDFKCGKKQEVGSGDAKWDYTPECGFGTVQTFEWAQLAGKTADAEPKDWAAKLTSKFGTASLTQPLEKDKAPETKTWFKWTADVAKVGDVAHPEATIYWSVAGSGTEDKDIANWKCSGSDLRVAGADTAKAWNQDTEQVWANRAADDAKNSIGGTCTPNHAEQETELTKDTEWKVDGEVKYWFSASTSAEDRKGAAAAQTYKITTASGAFAMTVAAGIVATAAVAF